MTRAALRGVCTRSPPGSLERPSQHTVGWIICPLPVRLPRLIPSHSDLETRHPLSAAEGFL
jgi:hypothetical protein